MGISSSAGSQQPDAVRRTIRFTFTATVAIPATCMILLWALAAGAVLGSSLHGHGFWSPDHREVVGLTILVGAGLVIRDPVDTRQEDLAPCGAALAVFQEALRGFLVVRPCALAHAPTV